MAHLILSGRGCNVCQSARVEVDVPQLEVVVAVVGDRKIALQKVGAAGLCKFPRTGAAIGFTIGRRVAEGADANSRRAVGEGDVGDGQCVSKGSAIEKIVVGRLSIAIPSVSRGIGPDASRQVDIARTRPHRRGVVGGIRVRGIVLDPRVVVAGYLVFESLPADDVQLGGRAL